MPKIDKNKLDSFLRGAGFKKETEEERRRRLERERREKLAKMRRGS